MSKYTDSPYRYIPDELVEEYTMNGKIPIFDWWIDASKKNGVQWTNEYIKEYCNRFTPDNIRNATEGESPYGHDVVADMLKSFEKYNIKNKTVAVVGSETPWIEAILINLNNKVTTIEYNVPETNYDNLVCEDYFTFFEKNQLPFDAIVTFSSVEHSGLGRYGDPLDPNGDFKTMDAIYNNLKSNGILVWGAPVGKDAFTWNVHRVYGEIRLPLLFRKFTEIDWFGISKETLFNVPLGNNGHHPVVVLKRCEEGII